MASACGAFAFFLPFLAQAMTISLPLTLNGRQLGNVPVSLSGMDVEAVSLESLKPVIGSRVSDHVWQAVAKADSDLVSLTALAEQGVEISFDPASLSLNASIQDSAQGKTNVNFGGGYRPFTPSESGTFSWLNNFNLSHDESWQQDDASRSTSLDWLTQINLGGAVGLNLTAANYFGVSNEEGKFRRGEITAFMDWPNLPLRAYAGDVQMETSGHMSTGSLGGISLGSAYKTLQPQREIGPENQQELILQEAADLQIVVNDQVIFSGWQEAGRFNLMNLPMANGANDIVVHISYLSGKKETRVFSQFYNSNLLKEGLINYAFSAGVPSTFSTDGVEYQNGWVAGGFVEYGLSAAVTVGMNGNIAQHGQLLGALATVGTEWGNLSARASVSRSKDDVVGNKISLNYESEIIGSGESASPNLRLSAEYADDFLSALWQDDQVATSYARYLANYRWTINDRWSLTLTGSYYEDGYDAEQTSFTSLVNWRHGNLTLGGGVNYYENDELAEPDTQYFLTLGWRWAHRDHGYNVSGSYNSQNNRARVDLGKSGIERVGSVGYRVQAEYDNDQDSESAQLSYTANRARVEAEVSRTNINADPSGASYSAILRGNTSIGFVDGKLGWGRATSGPFLIANLHPTLSGSSARLGTDQNDGYRAAATNIGGLMPLEFAYAERNVDINIPDAPLGYNWGESRLSFTPGAATGHAITLGSDNAYTVKGILVDSLGNPLSYLRGNLINAEYALPFFTNKQGRFFVQEAAPGTYRVEINDERYQTGQIEIPREQSSLIDVGIHQIACEETSCK
nr:fimbria/pilus outer membrane usher protein [Enterovibrio paralichthyis]